MNKVISKEAKREDIKGTKEWLEKYFPIVRASELSLEDDFLKHEPETYNQREFKNRLIKAIKTGLRDFRAQRMDASFEEGGNICYKTGIKPARGESANWWNTKAREFMPEKESRLGTTKERIAFLALIIKYLIEEKEYTVENAWKTVCDQSRDLGNYHNAEDAKRDFEATGSRQIGEWYDLANVYKITVDNENGGFSYVGGSCGDCGHEAPLANVDSFGDPDMRCSASSGWVVCSV